MVFPPIRNEAIITIVHLDCERTQGQRAAHAEDSRPNAAALEMGPGTYLPCITFK